MKRLLIPILLCALLLTACGKRRSEGDFRAFAERLNSLDTLSFTAQVRAEYEHKTARFALAYEEDREGGRVTVLAPELIRGVSARVKPGSSTLEYDSVVLDTGSLDSFGLSPLSSLPAMLRAMKADGIKWPFSASYTQFGPETIWNQFASFGVPENTYYYFIDADNKVQLTFAQDGWRACVEWLHQLYEEELMDPESLTQDSNLWANKVNDGEVGYFCYLRLINTAIKAENVENFKSILPPAADGFKACVSQILEVPEAGAYLTKNCKDPVAALKWIDAQLETETMMVSLNGRVGEQIVLKKM